MATEQRAGRCSSTASRSSCSWPRRRWSCRGAPAVQPRPHDHRGDLLREPGRRGHHVRRSAEHHHRHLAGVFVRGLCRKHRPDRRPWAWCSAIVYFFLCFRKELQSGRGPGTGAISYPNPKDAIENKRGLCDQQRDLRRGGGPAGDPRADRADRGRASGSSSAAVTLVATGRDALRAPEKGGL